MSKTKYYLWRDKNGTYYITDYDERNKDGHVKIDGRGYMDVELRHTADTKPDLMKWILDPKNK